MVTVITMWKKKNQTNFIINIDIHGMNIEPGSMKWGRAHTRLQLKTRSGPARWVSTGEIRQMNSSWHVKLREAPILVFINTVLLERCHSRLFMCCWWLLFSHYDGSCESLLWQTPMIQELATSTTWPRCSINRPRAESPSPPSGPQPRCLGNSFQMPPLRLLCDSSWLLLTEHKWQQQ